MTETNTALTEAIAKCDEIKARLETLREMSEPKPSLYLESVTTPVSIWAPRSADDLFNCPSGTVIITSDDYHFLRLGSTCSKSWICRTGNMSTCTELWHILTHSAENGIALKYLGNF